MRSWASPARRGREVRTCARESGSRERGNSASPKIVTARSRPSGDQFRPKMTLYAILADSRFRASTKELVEKIVEAPGSKFQTQVQASPIIHVRCKPQQTRGGSAGPVGIERSACVAFEVLRSVAGAASALYLCRLETVARLAIHRPRRPIIPSGLLLDVSRHSSRPRPVDDRVQIRVDPDFVDFYLLLSSQRGSGSARIDRL